MFVRKGNTDLAFDSIAITEGEFKFIPWLGEGNEGQFEMKLVAAYINSINNTTYGSCSVGLSLLSEDTVEAFRTFLESAEKDFGELIFSKGVVKSQLTGKPLPAENTGGLKKGLGE